MDNSTGTVIGTPRSGGRQAAIRLVIAYDHDEFRVIAQRRMRHVIPPSEPPEVTDDSSGFRIELRASDGKALFVRFLSDPRRPHREVPPGSEDGGFQRATVSSSRGTFAVLVPEIEEAQDAVLVQRSAAPGTLMLHSDELARFDLRDVRPSTLAPAQVRPASACNRIRRTEKIVNKGPDAHRWNLVILAEGYRGEELDSFAKRAGELAEWLLASPPFEEFQDAINIHRVDVESCESGADHPGGCEDGVEVDTYFDATFCRHENWPDRLLVVNTAKVIDVLEREVPHWDVGMVIVNSTKRGGSGADMVPVISAGSPFGVALHEIGHSAFGLADEYDYHFGPDDPQDFEPPDYRRYDGPEPQEPNLTAATTRSQAKWTHRIPVGSSLPTSEKQDCEQSDWGSSSPTPPGVVGLFEGAGYHRCGLFRPEFNCRMRQSNVEFCVVCRERIQSILTPYIEPVAVPDVVGMRERAALEALDAVKLTGRIGRRRLSDRPKGEVILQLPQAGRFVFKGTPVSIDVSLGEREPDEPQRIPNVVGMRDTDATAALRAEGFGTSLAFADSNKPFGEVIGQQPSGGTPAKPGTNVHLVASRGGDIRL